MTTSSLYRQYLKTVRTFPVGSLRKKMEDNIETVFRGYGVVVGDGEEGKEEKNRERLERGKEVLEVLKQIGEVDQKVLDVLFEGLDGGEVDRWRQ